VRALALAVVLLPAALLTRPFGADHGYDALAPAEILLDGHARLAGVAVGPDATVYVTEPERGRLLAVSPEGVPHPLARGLDDPRGLALDPEARLLVVERGRARVLRLEADGRRAVLARRLPGAEWIAGAPDGALYVGARRLAGEGGSAPGEAWVIVRLAPPGAAASVLARDLRGLEGLALDARALWAAADGAILRWPLVAGAPEGPPSRLAARETHRAQGLALDARGALYAADGDRIAKLHPDGRLTPFARHLDAPAGLALGPDGSLHVVEGGRGRLVRFRAPAPPALAPLAPYTAATAVTLRGVTEAGALIELSVEGGEGTPATLAGPDGTFAFVLPLRPAGPTRAEVLATARSGRGLTGAPARVVVERDGEPPVVAILAPAAAPVRGTVTVEARAADTGSAVAALALAAAGRALPAALEPAPPASAVTARAAWETATLGDGPHTLTATAVDRAGNRVSVSRVVVVDNTPPETTITGGPAGGAAGAGVTLTVAGEDNLTPAGSLVFAWRLDGGAFSAFAPGPMIALPTLAPGPHTLEVRARDLAGNEDPTPARATWSVASLRVAITAPAAGETVAAGATLVSGRVEGGDEVGVTVNGVPAVVRGAAFDALVPVLPPATLLAAEATSPDGARASDALTVGVTAAPASGAVLLAAPAAGPAPLTVSFLLRGLAPGAAVELDADGDGTSDLVAAAGDLAFTYVRPGLYVPVLTVTDPAGAQVTARALVHVYDEAALDGLLQARWRALKDALRQGDLDAATRQIALRSRARYSAIFRELVQDLPAVDTILTDLTLVEVRPAEGIYEMLRVDAGVTKSFEVRFRLDQDGIWRVWSF